MNGLKFRVGCLVLLISFDHGIAETYQDLKPTIDANCTRCHNEDGLADFLPLQTFDDIKPQPKKLLEVLASGRMPKDNPAFKTTPEGQRLIKWLTSGDDLYGSTPIPEHPIMKDPRTLTYVDIEPLIKRNCAGCHSPQSAGRRPVFATFQDVRNEAKEMYKELTRRRMPQGNPDFRFSADGRTILSWFEYGPDIAGQIDDDR